MEKKMRYTLSLLILLCCSHCFVFSASAESNKTAVPGIIYEYNKDGKYVLSADDATSISSTTNNTYGSFTISGDVASISEKNGVPSYEVSDGKIALYYTYSDQLLNAQDTSWHLIDDKSKTIDGISLESEIKKGAILLQTSKDQKNWVDVKYTANIFGDTPNQTDYFYTSTDVQMVSGCFYRFIVVYETARKVDPTKVLFLSFDNYEYVKHAEVYQFYAAQASHENSGTDERYNLGSRVRVEKVDGYSGEAPITKDDDHRGWDLGNFFVSGYTDHVSDTDGNMVFLKNVGDKVTLWFNLKENIDALQGNRDISITADTSGYDQYFETKPTDFGRGALIIRYTDSNNIHSEPQIYTNFLSANASVDADTKVRLFEEGDYEVALDYQITHKKIINTVSHYRIFFKFSVRNANCMVYPIDLVSGSELTNSAITTNGFRLDYANSQYLKVSVKHEVLKDSADGLVEDTRVNTLARDGAKYVADGVYTITVHNEYTNQSTTKRIYVGTNDVLKAYMTTGLSIPEINELLQKGAVIKDDGTIQLSSTPSPSPSATPVKSEAPIVSVADDPIESPAPPPEAVDEPTEQNISPTFILFGVVAFAVIVLVISLIIVKQKRSRQDHVMTSDNNNSSGGKI